MNDNIVKMYAWINPINSENPFHTTKPAIPEIAPKTPAVVSVANSANNTSPAYILPNKRIDKVNKFVNSSITLNGAIPIPDEVYVPT